jgi:hypothetical protein
MDVSVARSKFRSFHRRSSTVVPAAPWPDDASQASRLMAMNARLESRVRVLAKEREGLARLLDEANAALASAGVPYAKGNIRERISAYQVFRNLLDRRS